MDRGCGAHPRLTAGSGYSRFRYRSIPAPSVHSRELGVTGGDACGALRIPCASEAQASRRGKRVPPGHARGTLSAVTAA